MLTSFICHLLQVLRELFVPASIVALPRITTAPSFTNLTTSAAPQLHEMLLPNDNGFIQGLDMQLWVVFVFVCYM